MSKGRNELKKHVRAAREWLGEAEQSLDKEQDVRGDLNVMLAKAELQHAAETTEETGFVLWARRLLPLVIAAMLAGGWFYYTNRPEPVQPELPRAVTDKPVPVAKPEQTETTKITKITETKEIEEPAPRETEPAAATGPQIPEEDMQKLMCTAGQSLRAP